MHRLLFLSAGSASAKDEWFTTFGAGTQFGFSQNDKPNLGSHAISLGRPVAKKSHFSNAAELRLDPGDEANKILSNTFGGAFPEQVAALIRKDSRDQPQWQKFLLDSQLDVDRMDYLRRDSQFTGAGYGHFDWYRILNSMLLHDREDGTWDIVWPEKSKFAIEEYNFARSYMYQNVYFHKTSRGFEKLIEKLWGYARERFAFEPNIVTVDAIKDFWKEEQPRVEQYLRIEEFSVLHQMQDWVDSNDRTLGDLARRVLDRDRLVSISAPAPDNSLTGDNKQEWEAALLDVIQKAGQPSPEHYCLCDTLSGNKYYQPYFPEKESDEQSARNAIRLSNPGETDPVEISDVLDRLKPITDRPKDRYRYCVPEAARAAAERLSRAWGP